MGQHDWRKVDECVRAQWSALGEEEAVRKDLLGIIGATACGHLGNCGAMKDYFIIENTQYKVQLLSIALFVFSTQLTKTTSLVGEEYVAGNELFERRRVEGNA